MTGANTNDIEIDKYNDNFPFHHVPSDIQCWENPVIFLPSLAVTSKTRFDLEQWVKIQTLPVANSITTNSLSLLHPQPVVSALPKFKHARNVKACNSSNIELCHADLQKVICEIPMENTRIGRRQRLKHERKTLWQVAVNKLTDERNLDTSNYISIEVPVPILPKSNLVKKDNYCVDNVVVGENNINNNNKPVRKPKPKRCSQYSSLPSIETTLCFDLEALKKIAQSDVTNDHDIDLQAAYVHQCTSKLFSPFSDRTKPSEVILPSRSHCYYNDEKSTITSQFKHWFLGKEVEQQQLREKVQKSIVSLKWMEEKKKIMFKYTHSLNENIQAKLNMHKEKMKIDDDGDEDEIFPTFKKQDTLSSLKHNIVPVILEKGTILNDSFSPSGEIAKGKGKSVFESIIRSQRQRPVDSHVHDMMSRAYEVYKPERNKYSFSKLRRTAINFNNVYPVEIPILQPLILDNNKSSKPRGTNTTTTITRILDNIVCQSSSYPMIRHQHPVIKRMIKNMTNRMFDKLSQFAQRFQFFSRIIVINVRSIEQAKNQCENLNLPSLQMKRYVNRHLMKLDRIVRKEDPIATRRILPAQYIPFAPQSQVNKIGRTGTTQQQRGRNEKSNYVVTPNWEVIAMETDEDEDKADNDMVMSLLGENPSKKNKSSNERHDIQEKGFMNVWDIPHDRHHPQQTNGMLRRNNKIVNDKVYDNNMMKDQEEEQDIALLDFIGDSMSHYNRRETGKVTQVSIPGSMLCSPWSVNVAQETLTLSNRAIILGAPKMNLLPSLVILTASYLRNGPIDTRVAIICDGNSDEEVSHIHSFFVSCLKENSIKLVRNHTAEYDLDNGIDATGITSQVVIVDRLSTRIGTDFSLLLILLSIPDLLGTRGKRRPSQRMRIQDAMRWKEIESIYIASANIWTGMKTFLKRAKMYAEKLDIFYMLQVTTTSQIQSTQKLQQQQSISTRDNVNGNYEVNDGRVIFFKPTSTSLQLCAGLNEEALKYLDTYNKIERQQRWKNVSTHIDESIPRVMNGLNGISLSFLKDYMSCLDSWDDITEQMAQLTNIKQAEIYALHDGIEIALEYLADRREKHALGAQSFDCLYKTINKYININEYNVDHHHHGNGHSRIQQWNEMNGRSSNYYMNEILQKAFCDELQRREMENENSSEVGTRQQQPLRPLVITDSNETCEKLRECSSSLCVTTTNHHYDHLQAAARRYSRNSNDQVRIYKWNEIGDQLNNSNIEKRFTHVYHVTDSRDDCIPECHLSNSILQCAFAGIVRLISVCVDSNGEMSKEWKDNSMEYDRMMNDMGTENEKDEDCDSKNLMKKVDIKKVMKWLENNENGRRQSVENWRSKSPIVLPVDATLERGIKWIRSELWRKLSANLITTDLMTNGTNNNMVAVEIKCGENGKMNEISERLVHEVINAHEELRGRFIVSLCR